jgi:hypothetical protein
VVVAGTLTLGAVRNAGLIARTAKDVIEVIPTVKEAIGLAPGGEVIKLPPGEGDSHLLPSGPEEPDFTVDIDAP